MKNNANDRVSGDDAIIDIIVMRNDGKPVD
jgi:hypothetical protein